MRVLIVCHEDLVPPTKLPKDKHIDDQPWRTEYFVGASLRRGDHDVLYCGLDETLDPLERELADFKPDVVFNLLEEFAGEVTAEDVVPRLLEKRRIPYTGCSAEGLLITRDKKATREVLEKNDILVPRLKVYPAIVKAAAEDSSLGISDKSIVHGPGQFRAARQRLRQRGVTDILCEEYIEGRELSLSLIWTSARSEKPVVFPPWEMTFGTKPGPKIATEKVKWSHDFRKRHGIKIGAAKGLSRPLVRKLKDAAIRACEALSVNGLARVDFRINEEGDAYILEVNANPDLARYDELAMAARAAGWSYRKLLTAMLTYALDRANQQ